MDKPEAKDTSVDNQDTLVGPKVLILHRLHCMLIPLQAQLGCQLYFIANNGTHQSLVP